MLILFAVFAHGIARPETKDLCTDFLLNRILNTAPEIPVQVDPVREPGEQRVHDAFVTPGTSVRMTPTPETSPDCG